MKKALSLLLAMLMLLCAVPFSASAANHVHNYGEPEWIWDEDFNGATAVFTCQDDPDHVETVYGSNTGAGWSPNCTERGNDYRHVNVAFNGKQYHTSKDIDIPALGHSIPAEGGCFADEHPHYFEYVCDRCRETITDMSRQLEDEDCGICAPKPRYIDREHIINVPYKSDASALELRVTAHYYTDHEYSEDITAEIEPFDYDSDTVGDKVATITYIHKDSNMTYTTTVEYTVEYTWWQWLIRIFLLGFIWY